MPTQQMKDGYSVNRPIRSLMETDHTVAVVKGEALMPYELSNKFVICISSRALFYLDEKDTIFNTSGLTIYRQFQQNNEAVPLKPGTASPLMRELLAIHKRFPESVVEVLITSKNHGDSGLRIWSSIQTHDLTIERGSSAGGADPHNYLSAWGCKLFLPVEKSAIREALAAGSAAGLVYSPPDHIQPSEGKLRIALDADALPFSAESEQTYQKQILETFLRHGDELAADDTCLTTQTRCSNEAFLSKGLQ